MQKNDIVTLTVEEINNLGNGIGHLPAPDGGRGQVVFVRGGVTGDLLRAKIIKVTKGYAVAVIDEILKPSPYRVENDCSARGCGGCVYRHISYEHELKMKRDYVRAAFQKAGLSHVTVADVAHTGVLSGYRNKAQYPVAETKNGITAGFFAGSSHRLVEAHHCRLQPPIFGELTKWICDFCTRHRISAYQEECGQGLLRHIYLRMGQSSGEVMVTLVVNGEQIPHEADLVKGVTARFPQVVSLLLNINQKNTNVVLGEHYRTLWGKGYINDTLCGLDFEIAPDAFYQVNHDGCQLLYSIAREKAAITGDETLLDLYCGIGTIGLSMADAVREVVGIEIVPAAVECANRNAKSNGISNARFYCGDASDARRLLENAEAQMGKIENATVILDPPRKGSTKELIEYLSERQFNRVVYVSCNPDTLARDCAWFAELGYEIGEVTPVDMFPRTGHVESVVLLCRAD